MKKIETFEEYIQRLLDCGGLNKKLREEAAKKLLKMFNRDKYNVTNKRIRFSKMKKNPNLMEMFEWDKTKEGFKYWHKISDAGF
jgi:hypothetical protein